LTLTRSVAAPPALGTQEYDNASILYLKPGALTAGRVDEIAAKIRAAPKGKILLDLRDATGDAAQGLRLANFFVKEGTLATLQGQQFPTQSFTADPAIFLTAAPLAVLVNRGTYGGPELAANAIEDLKRGDVVGERTFGEGSFQKSIELPGGADLLLTVAKFESPSGNKIQDNAVTPNVVVASPLDDQEEGAAPTKGDDMLNKALDLLKAKSS
jgi:carboxyl-terminal processing protease